MRDSELAWYSSSVTHQMDWSKASKFTLFGSPDLPDQWDSCNASKISSTLWLLYYDQLYLHLLDNKRFWWRPDALRPNLNL